MPLPIDIDLFKKNPQALDDYLQSWIGHKMNTDGTNYAPDPVNMPMIRHWLDAFDDRNPVYEDETSAMNSRFKSLIAPPAMMQTWIMPRPILRGIAERGGSAQPLDPDTPLPVLDRVGYTGILATNSDLEFSRPLRNGDLLCTEIYVESISPRKKTGLGLGYFVTWTTDFIDQHQQSVGRQSFRVLKFDSSTIGQ
jgi:hypothetical protein